MSIQGFIEVSIDKFGGLVDRWPAEKLPIGVSPDCRNVRFTGASVRTRDGLTLACQTPDASYPVTGLGVLIRGITSAPWLTQSPIAFDYNGKFFFENPAGQGTLTQVSPSTGSLPTSAYMEIAPAYNRAFCAFGDLRCGTGAAYHYDGTNLDPVSLAPQSVVAMGNASINAGDVPTGVRYAMVLFQTRSGYISGAANSAIFTVNQAAASRKVSVFNIPTSPNPNVTARLVAFTQAGAGPDGPFYYVGTADSSLKGLLGLNAGITTTVISDNSTIDAEFNFTDEFLIGSTEVTEALRKIQLPNQTAVTFVPSARRLFWTGEAANPSMVRVSEADDPETYFGDTGYLLVSENDGERVMGVREFKSEIYVVKERSGYLVIPNNDDPANWTVQSRWKKVGAVGPRALDVGKEFMAMADRSGAYTFTGDTPTMISAEIEKTWARINWKVGHLIWVQIDETNKEIRFGVPLDQSTVPNVELVCNYTDGLGDSISEHPYYGLYYQAGRRWNINDIQANSCVRIERELASSPNPATPVDSRIAKSQILYASANYDGAINFLDPTNVGSDNGQSFDSYYVTAYGQSKASKGGANVGTDQLGGVHVAALGDGQLKLTAISKNGTLTQQLRGVNLREDTTEQLVLANRLGSRWALKFETNDSGAWFELIRSYLYVKSFFEPTA